MFSILSPIHRDGWKFIGIFAAIAAVLYFLHPVLGCMGAVLTVWCCYFFRKPNRVIPAEERWITSPADGLITRVSTVTPEPSLGLNPGEYHKISIFLSVFDVHVQRLPVAGQVQKILYTPGRFVSATLDKSSEENERQTIVITHKEHTIGCTQIAGLIARRIVTEIAEGDQGVKGQIYGLIRFGSRVDLYLPVTHTVLRVEVGQRMIGGETIMAEFVPSPTE